MERMICDCRLVNENTHISGAGAIIRRANRPTEEKAGPRPSIRRPPPSASAELFLDQRLIMVFNDLHIISSIRCTFKAVLLRGRWGGGG